MYPMRSQPLPLGISWGYLQTQSRKGCCTLEALTAVSVAALTVYDMCKAVQKDMEITNIRLLEKSGGKSGDYKRED